jgi:hypothetical protein
MEEMEKRSDRHIRDLVAHTAFKGLALQLPFCFEVRTLSDRLVSSAPE